MSKNKNKKKPKSEFQPPAGKHPREPGGFSSPGKGEPREPHLPSAQRQPPSWQFQTLDFPGPFCKAGIDSGTLQYVIEQLTKFETMLWGDIEGKRHHSIKLDEICPEARSRLRELKLDDIEEVFSLRIGNKPRIIGIRAHTVLRLLWWDPEHQVCPWKGADN